MLQSWPYHRQYIGSMSTIEDKGKAEVKKGKSGTGGDVSKKKSTKGKSWKDMDPEDFESKPTPSSTPASSKSGRSKPSKPDVKRTKSRPDSGRQAAGKKPDPSAKPQSSTSKKDEKQAAMEAQMAKISGAKPFVIAPPEMKRAMNKIAKFQEPAGHFHLTVELATVLGLNYNVLKMECISKSYNTDAFATTLVMVYIDRKAAPLKTTYQKEYDRAKLWVYKNYAVSQKRLQRSAETYFNK